MHKEIQYILRNSPTFFSAQAWVNNKVSYLPNYNIVAQKALYWHIAITRASNYAGDLNYAIHSMPGLGRQLTSFFKEDLEEASFDNIYLPQKLLNAINADKERARSRSSSIAVSVDDPNEHAKTLALNFIEYFEPELFSSVRSQTERLPTPFLVEHATNQLIHFVDIFTVLPDHERTKESIEKIRAIFKNWKKLAKNKSKINTTFRCPDQNATRQEWIGFNTNLQKELGGFLIRPINTNERTTLTAYLEANQLFWECLKETNLQTRNQYQSLIFASL